MAKMTLPTPQTMQTTMPTPGRPAVVGAVANNAAVTVTPALSVSEVGERAADMTTDVQSTQTLPVQSLTITQSVQGDPGAVAAAVTETLAVPRVLEPTATQAQLAQLEQKLQRLQVEVVALTQIAQSTQATQNQAQQTTAQSIAQLTQKTREAVDLLTQGRNEDFATLRRQIHELSADIAAQLTIVSEALAARGIVAEVVKPKLTLHRVRRVLKPAAINGDAVVLYYNPRQAGDGGTVQDEIELRLKPDVVRNVHVGYKLDVPAGYVCDVSFGNDVVASYRGRGDQELVLPLRARPAFGALLSSGQELCRLTLRKAAALDLVLVE